MKQKDITFPSGEKIPAVCMGTWYLGGKTSRFSKEVDLVRDALDSGCRVFDTAEAYGNGGAEEVLGEALKDCRKDVFLISKALPEHGGYDSLLTSCENTLERLQTDYLDMYMIHWHGEMLDLSEMYDAFRDLRRQKLIRFFGVSNFDADELENWLDVVSKEDRGACQTLYNLFHRSHCKKLIKTCRKNGVPVMAFFPYESGGFVFENGTLKQIAQEKGVTPRQLSMAWTLARENTGIVFKAKKKKDIQDVFCAQDVTLSARDMSLLDKTFPIFA